MQTSWCLAELSYIMKCRHERGLIVMPIFYDMDPSEARSQKGKFGEAFAKQEAKNITEANLWRKALVDSSYIAGWELKNIASGHESKVIKEVVEKILKRLFSLDSDIDEELVGMEDRSSDLISRLEIESGGVTMIGIWGIGGSGKTTLAFSVYKEISRHFQGHCYIANIREQSQHGLETLQQNFLSTVMKIQVGVQSVEEGKHIIRTRLCNSKVLVVLDDVNDLDQLEALVGSHKWFGDGSRIIITTRDEHLLRTHRVDHVCLVRLLSVEESIRLFYKHAYNETDPLTYYEELSLRVVSYSAGLPLALKVLGSFLFDKDGNEWKSALAKLKDIPDFKIMNILKISYDGLEAYQKELFLHIACFFRWESIDDVMEILEACGFHPVIGIKVLRQKALITISDGKFNMHDLVQEMGHYIVRGEHPNNPTKLSRFRKYKEISNMCFGDATLENDKIEAIQYYCSYHYQSSCFSKIISNMKKLRSLSLSKYYKNVNDDGKYVERTNILSNELGYINWTNLAASPFPNSSRPKNHFILYLNCSFLGNNEVLILLDDAAGLGQLQALAGLHKWLGEHLLTSHRVNDISTVRLLSIEESIRVKDIPDIKILNILKISYDGLWKGCMHLPHLKVLELCYLKNLLGTPDFGGLPCLQKLKLGNCIELEEIHPSLGNHKSLAYISVCYCNNLRSFPTIVQLENLKTLEIKCCPLISEFPQIQSNMESLVKFSLRKIWKFETQVETVFELTHILGKMNLSSLLKLDFSSRGLRSNLEELDPSDHSFLQLGFSPAQIILLKILRLTNCTRLVKLPEPLSSVAILEANYCDSLTTIADCHTNFK